MIERRIFGVELLALILHIGEAVVGRRRAVEHSEAIAHQLAVIDQRVLYLHAGAARTSDDTDLFDVMQREQTGALFGFERYHFRCRSYHDHSERIIAVSEREKNQTPCSVRPGFIGNRRGKPKTRGWCQIENSNITGFTLGASVGQAQRALRPGQYRPPSPLD